MNNNLKTNKSVGAAMDGTLDNGFYVTLGRANHGVVRRSVCEAVDKAAWDTIFEAVDSDTQDWDSVDSALLADFLCEAAPWQIG